MAEGQGWLLHTREDEGKLSPGSWREVPRGRGETRPGVDTAVFGV